MVAPSASPTTRRLERLIVVVERGGRREDEEEDGSPARRAGPQARSPGWPSAGNRRRPSPSGPPPWSRPAGRPARCAGCRSTPGPRLPPHQRPPATGDLTGPPGPPGPTPGAGAGADAGGAEVPVAAAVLAHGEMTVHGRIAGSSNVTLLVASALNGRELLAVYKPAHGERPLWDFPRGLGDREVAAYELSETLGWGVVPETVHRADRPVRAGVGPALRRRGRRVALLHPARPRVSGTRPW